jgi:beta-lactamase superfamily II metal-dependent hydrolase
LSRRGEISIAGKAGIYLVALVISLCSLLGFSAPVYGQSAVETWDLPYGLDEDPIAINLYQFPGTATTVTMADIEDTMPAQLLVVWNYGGPGVGWKFFVPGWGASNTLIQLVPGKYYVGIVSHATSWELPSTPPPLEELEVSFIDVGQGDSILLDLGTTEVLIDGGPMSPGIVPYLQQYVDGPLEAMIATHPHADHIGDLIAVLDSFDVERIWTNGQTSGTQTYIDFMAKVNTESADVEVARRGETISVGNLSFEVLNPVEPLFGDYNNDAIVLMLRYGDIDFLFMGDAEQEAEAGMIATNQLEDIDILKVGHHGSNTASSQAFLEEVSPEVAIYMAGIGNQYGHPHAETITALQNIGTQIYGTDNCGTVIVSTDGNSYTVSTTKTCATPSPTPTPSPSPTPTEASDVQIVDIFYDGIVPQVESDEYVAIKNLGNSPENLAGWRLVDISDGHPSFTFPGYMLQLQETIRVYTNEIHVEWGGFSFGYGQAIWNNSDPDTAVLYDEQDREVSRRSY